MRAISHSEVAAMLDCQARHAFRYTGALTGGDALKPKVDAPVLRDGRAWGVGVAEWHEHRDIDRARAVMCEVLAEAADTDTALLVAILGHYADTAEPLNLSHIEAELDVPIPSRAGRRASTVYRLLGFIDGLHTDDDGRLWIVDFKLRGQLTSLELVALDRQFRWYAWAWERLHGSPIAGVIVDERLKAAPKPARILASGKVSHAKDQMTTPALYREACAAAYEPARYEVVEALAARQWQARHVVMFRRDEIAEAGAQLVSAARQVRGLDSGELYPVRNPSPQRCGRCGFKSICADPSDHALVDAWFERVPPKRERQVAHAA